MLAEVIAIGDELTSGARLDTNSQWISRRLTDLGIEVRYHSTVGDDLQANADVFRIAIQRADFVVATGGLGPTADDLTREALAIAVGVPVVRDPVSLAHIEQLFVSRGREMPAQNARQADFPQGATAIPNPHGSAPGVQLEVARGGQQPSRVYCVPGVPAEMREMWDETVGPEIVAALPEPRVTQHFCLKCFGTGESHLETMLPDLIRRGREPKVGITVSQATITLRISATAADQSACLEAMQPTIQTIREKLGVLVFGEESDELHDVVSRLLAERGQRLAITESWTGGLLGTWLASVQEGKGVFHSGRLTAGQGLVEPETVLRTAIVLQQSQPEIDYAIAIGSPNASDLTQVAVAIAGANVQRVKQYPTVGHPSIIKARAAKQALDLLRIHLIRQD